MDFINSSNVTPCDNSSGKGSHPILIINDKLVLASITLCLSVLTVFTVVSNLTLMAAVVYSYVHCSLPGASGKVHMCGSHITKILMTSLALDGTVVGGVVMPLWIIQTLYKEQGLFSNASCRYMSLFDIFICKVCSLHVLFMAVDRYLAVCRPLFHRMLGAKMGVAMVGLSWLIPLVITALSDFLDWVVVENFRAGCVEVCKVKHSSVLSVGSAFVTVFIPFIMICVLYLLILIEIGKFHKRKRNKVQLVGTKVHTKSSKPIEAFGKSIWYMKYPESFAVDSIDEFAACKAANVNPPITSKHAESPPECSLSQPASVRTVDDKTSKSQIRARSNNKAFLTIGLLISSCIVCWLPFAIFLCMHGLNKDIEFPIWTVILFSWLGYLNSALNPMFFCCHQSMRRSLKMLLSSLAKTYINGRSNRGNSR